MRYSLLLIAAAMMGCGGGGAGSSDTPPPVVPPPGPVLQSISIPGGSRLLGIDDMAALTAIGHFDDASQSPVVADWTLAGAAISIDHSPASTVVVTAIAEGATDVTATFGGFNATVTVTVAWWVAPTDPGPVYGADYSAVLSVPSDGSAPASVGLIPDHKGYGLVLNRQGTYLYDSCEYDINGQGYRLKRFNLSTGAVDEVSANYDIKNPWGLDYDSLDRVYINGAGDGKVYRYDPATGATALFGNSGGGTNDIAIDGGDNVYYSKLLPSGGDTWVLQHRFFAGGFDFAVPWATAPAAETGYFVPGGLAMNSHNEAFIMNCTGTTVYRLLDVNGDGTCSNSETTTFASLPGAAGDNFTFGIAVVRGRGVLINRNPAAGGGGAANAGIFWLADRNGDGAATGAGEITLLNGNYFYNGFDGGCLTAPR